jgi:hypothetical protein
MHKYSFVRINLSTFILGVVLLFNIGINDAAAAPIKILNNSNHSYGTIGNTINQLLGRPYTSSEFIIDYTTSASYSCSGGANYFAGLDPSVAVATSSSVAYCNSSSATTTPPIPYQIFSTSYTGNPGDSVATYNTFAPYDITDDYAFTASPAIKMPPAFYTAPGNDAFPSAQGVEWKIPTTLYGGGDLSGATAANTGFMAWLRLNHPTWNWFDVKAAVRQTAANWVTGYDSTNYGFGLLSTSTANTLTDNQILLQPPEVATSTSGSYNQLTFTLFPFRQTRRVKDVLFQFASNPGFQANELTLANIQALGGTKVTDYSGTLATTTAPIFTSFSNTYFVWFTADNANDTASTTHFSRIDTYNVLGPLSQNEIPFSSTFDVVSPANNAISTTSSPTFSWNAASSYLGISKYQLFIDGVLDKDNITGTSTTPTASLSDGAHTWYVKAFNGGGTATSSVSTPTININSNYAPGYTFYVDNVLGNDNNPGTQSLPWATLAKAGSTAQAGDTVIIIKNAGNPYRARLTPSNAGSSGSPITFRGVGPGSKPEIWGSDDVSGGWSIYNGGNPNTYQKAVTISPNIVYAGPSASNLSSRVWGSSLASLNPGEWTFTSGVLYYRLASGEDISTLHIEAGARGTPISSSKNYIMFKNLVVRYGNTYGMSISGTGSIAEGIEAYDSSDTGIQIGSNATVRYSVAARNGSYGIWGQYGTNLAIYNNLMYGNGSSGLNFDAIGPSNTATVKNNISAGNTRYSFSSNYYFGAPIITAGYNAWDIAGDSHWDTYKGTNNQELVNSLLVDPVANNFALQQFSPDIDSGTNVGLTTDILGNPIYGTPDIGPYEYQPPYSITGGGVPIGGSFRVYKDGHYRMTTATSSAATANMSIAPVGGFPSGDYSEWLNVTVNTWNTTGDYTKSWTESSSAATSTVHTIGDLAANGFYKVTVDGADYAKFRADSGGQGTFTYSGGYSTHTFSIAPDLSVGGGPVVGSSFGLITDLASRIPTPPAAMAGATSTQLVATTSTPMQITATTTIQEQIIELQTKLVSLLKELIALLSKQLQNAKKSIYQ